MKRSDINKQYAEYLPESFLIRHKITTKTEKKNFHLHEQVEIILALSDNLIVRFEDRSLPIPKDSLLLLDSMNLHYITSREDSGLCDRYVLYFSPDYVSWLSTPELNLMECFLTKKEDPCILLQIPDSLMDILSNLLEQLEDLSILRNANPENYNFDLYQKLIVGQFLLLANFLYSKQYGSRNSPFQKEHAAIVADICSYIKENYRTELRIPSLAHRFSISKTMLYSIFTEVLGISVNEYITDCRIAKAKDLLINSTYSVEIISDLVGCSSISSFSRLFKNRTDTSPLQYRKQFAAGGPGPVQP